jgi:hypothetical protein
MKTALLTLYFDNYQPLADLVLPNWKQYCDRHGYELIAYRGEYMPGYPIGFQKVCYAYDQMFSDRGDIDVLLVLDLDLIITNHTVPVSAFLDENHDYFVTADVNGLNNGVFIIKKTQGAKEVLEYIVENKHHHRNEQDTLKFHLDEPVLQGRLKIVQHPSFNSYWYDLYPEQGDLTGQLGNWRPGHFILHLPGMDLNRRLQLLQSERARNIVVT